MAWRTRSLASRPASWAASSSAKGMAAPSARPVVILPSTVLAAGAHRTVHLVVHAGVDGGLPAAQQAKARQHRGPGADGRHDLAGLGAGDGHPAHIGVGGQVVHARNAAGQDAGVVTGGVDLAGHGVGHDLHLVGRHHRFAAAHRRDGHLNAGAAQDIHHQQALALLQARRKKHNSFGHR